MGGPSAIEGCDYCLKLCESCSRQGRTVTLESLRESYTNFCHERFEEKERLAEARREFEKEQESRRQIEEIKSNQEEIIRQERRIADELEAIRRQNYNRF